MDKWCGKVGYSVTEETEPGIWESKITEYEYYGNLVKNTIRRFQSSGEVNDNINILNNISIVADPFAYGNFRHIVYAEFMGVKWKVSDVEVKYPRLILTLGGVYNDQQT